MMIFRDSVVGYSDPNKKYLGTNFGTASVDTTVLTPKGNPSLKVVGNLYVPVPAADTYIVGFRYRWDGTFASIGAANVWSFYDAFGSQCRLELTSTGAFSFIRGTTTTNIIAGPSSTIMPVNTWKYIEIKVKISATVGFVTVYLDGNHATPLLSATNVNTLGSSFGNITLTGPASYVSAGGSSVACWYSDIVIMDTTGSRNNDFLGEVYVQGDLPTGDGSTQQWTSNVASWPSNTALNVGTTITDGTNYQRVTAVTGDQKTGGSAPTWNVTLGGTTTDNHVTWTNIGSPAAYKLVNEPYPDSDYSYRSDSTVGHTDLFTFPSNISGTTVYDYAITRYAEKDNTGARAIQGVIKSGATTAADSSDSYLTYNSYTTSQAHWETDPNTSSAWTAAAANAAEGGLKVSV